MARTPAPRTATGWLGLRLRAAPGSALAFALLVLVTVFSGAALPRLVDTYETDALRQSLRHAQPGDRLISGTAPASPADETVGTGTADARRRVLPPAVSSATHAFQDALKAPLRVDRGGAAYGVHNRTPAVTKDPGLPRAHGSLPSRATLVVQQRLADHARLTAGRMPRPAVGGGPGESVVEAVVTTRTAHTMKLAPGDSFHLPGSSGATTVRVTGLITPREARGGAYWTAEDSLRRPTLVKVPPSAPGDAAYYYWHFTAFLNPGATPALAEMRDGAELFWHFPLAAHALHAYQVPAMRRQLTSLSVGAGATRLQHRAQVGQITLDDGLSGVLEGYGREQAAVSPLLLTATLGLGTAAVTVLVLSGVLAAERRRSELDLLRARGGSLPGITGRLLAETSGPALPAAVAGTALALLCTPAGRYGSSFLLASGVTAVAVLALPLRAALTHRRPLTGDRRTDLLHVRPSRRRTVCELTVLALVMGAVVALRQRGTGTGDAGGTRAAGAAGGGPDPLLAAAPVLLALAVALLLLRCCPLPLRLLSRPAARRPGTVAFLGLARAGRTRAGAAAGLPLIAVLVTLTLASFGGTVLAGIADGRDAAALRAVGADVRIEAPGLGLLPTTLPGRVRKTAGVDEIAAFRLHDDGEVVDGGDNVTVIIADAPSYARLAARTGRGAFPPGALDALDPRAGRTGPVPAIASPGLAQRFAGKAQGTEVALPGLGLAVRTALVRAETPAVADGEFLVVSRDAVARTRPGTAGTALLAPNTLLATARSPDTAALRKLTRGDDFTLGLRARERAAYDDSVLQSGAEQLYLAAILAASAYSALAVLLSLSQSAPERMMLLARLRTMGLPRREGRGLLLVESLPAYVLTAGTAALTGLLAVPLLGPGIDLDILAGTPDTTPVRPVADPTSLLLPPLALLVLVCGGMLMQAHLAARRTTELRMEAQ